MNTTQIFSHPVFAAVVGVLAGFLLPKLWHSAPKWYKSTLKPWIRYRFGKFDTLFEECPTPVDSEIQDVLESNKDTENFDFLNPRNNFSDAMKHIDRSVELKELEEFINADGIFAVRILVGPDGVGKTQLAMSFHDHVKKNRSSTGKWDVLMLKEDRKDTLSMLLSLTQAQKGWHPQNDTLVFIEDAARHVDTLCCWIEELLKFNFLSAKRRSHRKIRLVLIEREADFENKDSWLENMYSKLAKAFQGENHTCLEKAFGLQGKEKNEERKNERIIRLPLLRPAEREKILEKLCADLKINQIVKGYLTERAKHSPGLGTAQNLIIHTVNKSRHKEMILGIVDEKIKAIEKIVENEKFDKLFFCCLMMGVILHGTMSKNSFRKIFIAEWEYWKEKHSIRFGESDEEYARLFERHFKSLCSYFGTNADSQSILNPNDHLVVNGRVFMWICDFDENSVFFKKRDVLLGFPERYYRATKSKSVFFALIRVYQEFRNDYSGNAEDRPLWLDILKRNIERIIETTEELSDIEYYLENPALNNPITGKFRIKLLHKAMEKTKEDSIESADIQVKIAEALSSSASHEKLEDALGHTEAAREIYKKKIADIDSQNSDLNREEIRRKWALATSFKSYLQMNFVKTEDSRNHALKLAEEARNEYEELEKSNHSLEYAQCLLNYGTICEKLGKSKDSLDTLNAVVKLGTENLKNNGDDWRQLTAAAHLERGRVCSIFGLCGSDGPHGAIPATPLGDTRGAVDIYEDLKDINPQVYLPDYAAALNQLGDRLREGSGLENYTLSISSTQESLDLYKSLDEIVPDVYMPHLAGCYVNQARKLKHIGKYEDSFNNLVEAHRLRKILWKANRETYSREYVESLTLLAKEEWLRGKYADAGEHIREACKFLEERHGNEDRASKELRFKVLEIHTFILIHQGRLVEAEKEAESQPAEILGLIQRFSGMKYWSNYIDFLIHQSDIQRRIGNNEEARKIADCAFKYLHESDMTGEDFRVQCSRVKRRRAKASLNMNKAKFITSGATDDALSNPCARDMEEAVRELVGIEEGYENKRNNIRLIASRIDYAQALIFQNLHDETTLNGQLDAINRSLEESKGKFPCFKDIYSELDARMFHAEATRHYKKKDYKNTINALKKCDGKYAGLFAENPLYYAHRLVNCRRFMLRALIAGNEITDSAVDEFRKKTQEEILDGHAKDLKANHSESFFLLQKIRCHERMAEAYEKLGNADKAKKERDSAQERSTDHKKPAAQLETASA